MRFLMKYKRHGQKVLAIRELSSVDLNAIADGVDNNADILFDLTDGYLEVGSFRLDLPVWQIDT